jgi:Arc/MetJ family transcription regulator
MTQVAVDDNLVKETQRLSGLTPEKIADVAIRRYLDILLLHERWEKLEKDDWLPDEPPEIMAATQ